MKKEMSAPEVAQGTKLVKQLCELFGGKFVSEVENSDAIRDNRQNLSKNLPERAWVLMEQARDGGLLDAEWRPRVSRRRAALLAQIISKEVFGANRWKVFEELWGIKNLQQYYQTAQYLNTIDSDKAAYMELLGIKVRY